VPTALANILIVEDDHDMNAAIRGLLADEAIAALSATSLKDAREYLATEVIVGVVLDYTLPDGTAEHLLDELAAAPYAPGAVLTSAHPNAVEIANLYRIPFIRKPFDLDVLLSAVRLFLAGQSHPIAVKKPPA
jgi:DNA-binding NtrC family response regulator